jgi:LDH2 family malate/lactate/ureidoglycolate dehydrogenase
MVRSGDAGCNGDWLGRDTVGANTQLNVPAREAKESAMPAASDTMVRVQQEWDGWRTADVPLQALHNIHWLQPAGAPRPLAHAYVSCAGITSGSLQHECSGAASSHQLLVCVLKRHTAAAAWSEIERQANAGMIGMAAAGSRSASVPPSHRSTP